MRSRDVRRARGGDKEDQGGDVLEAMDPLLMLGSLAASIDLESSLDTGVENILVSGYTVRGSHVVNGSSRLPSR